MAYDYAPNPDKQWILQFTGRMHDIQLKFTDVLMTKRLQTLQTIDESVQRIINTLESLGELDNTYIFYTSDHGYHLGQFGLVKGKSMPFEFDIKVPFLVRGPGIKPGAQVNNIALNVDLAPTFLDIAGIKVPAHMDGRSLLPLLKGDLNDQGKIENWRDTFLVESSGRIREEDALELRKERQEQRAQGLIGPGIEGGLFTSKHERLELVCESEKYHSPCKPLQTWECVHDGLRWRLKKCRFKSRYRRRNCICEPDRGMGFLVKLDSEERRKQRLFLKKHVTQDLKKYDPKFLKAFSDVDSSEVAEETLGRVQRNSRWYHGSLRKRARYRRSTIPETGDEDTDYDLLEEEASRPDDDDDTSPGDPVDAFVSEEEMRAIDDKIITLADELEGLETVSSTSASLPSGNQSLSDQLPHGMDSSHLEHGCTATETSVDCTDEVYQDPHAWKVSKAAIDDQIRRLRHQLFVLKDVRKHLRNSRPNSIVDLDDYDYDAQHEDYGDISVGDILGEDQSRVEGSGYVEKDAREPTPFAKSPTVGIYPNGTFNVSEHRSVDTAMHTGSPFEDAEGDFDHGETTESSLSAISEDSFEDIISGEEIIIGRDYEADGDRGHRDNTLTRKRRPKERKDKFDIFRDTPHTRIRNKHRNRKNHRVDENETALEVDGMRPRGQLEPASQFEFYPSRTLTQDESTSVADNETTPKQAICWCDKRQATKLAIQQERAKKRAERQKLKLERLKRKEQKMKRKMRKSKDTLAECSHMYSKLNCYQHDNDHWKTPPLWHDGKFCFCMNAPNNTYWCLRTINDTHNYLYCEFITGLVTYYDLNIDPYQLRNVAFTLSNSRLAELHLRLEKLRVCVGSDQCDNLPHSQDSASERPEEDIMQEVKNTHAIMNNVVLPVRRLTKAERMQEREERRRLRKLSKKIRRNQLYASKNRHVLDAVGSGEHKVRIPRKSRLEKEKRRERQRERRERKKKKKSRKNKKLRRE